MKYKSKYLNIYFISIAFLAYIFSACSESIEIGKLNEENYTTSEEAIGYIIDNQGKRILNFVEFRAEGQVDIRIGLTKEAKENAVVTLKYDADVLEAYNKANETNYALYPSPLVQFNSDLAIAKGSKKSEENEVKFSTNESLDTNLTYAIPLSAQVKSGNVQMAEKESSFIILVKDLSKIPTADKSTGIKIISCMEVNDTNPLNNLCFTLKESGKPLFDQVILFSSNINYNNETGRVYVYHNPNVQHLLDNKEKYLKPLQDRGIKVLLSVLGNHDRSGVANLADETAQAFAQELKAQCDAYNLDGVFFDDEYSKYQTPPPPGFVRPSSQAAARLCYETKKAMPDKIISVYVYGLTYSLPNVDEIQSGTFVDYGLHDYGRGSDLSNNYPGMPKSGMGLYSQEFSRGYIANIQSLRNLRNGGYGAHMIFAMDPNRMNFQYQQLPALRNVATYLFDEELVYNGKPYRKDW